MKGGDEAAFAALVERHATALGAYIKRSTGAAKASGGDFEDLLQAALFRAWELRASCGDADGGGFYRWLVSIARNVVGDRMRHDQAAKRAAPGRSLTTSAIASTVPDSITSVSSKLARSEDIEKVDRFLSGLPIERRRVVELYFLEGESLREIATATGRARSTVWDDLKAAMTAMQGILGS